MQRLVHTDVYRAGFKAFCGGRKHFVYERVSFFIARYDYIVYIVQRFVYAPVENAHKVGKCLYRGDKFHALFVAVRVKLFKFATRNTRRNALKIQVRVLSDSRLSFTVRYILAQLKLNFNLLSGKYTAKLNILPETFFIYDYPKGFLPSTPAPRN